MMIYNLYNTTIYADIEIPVKVNENIDVNLGGLKLSIRKGTQINLPLRIILPLLRKKLVDIDINKIYSISDIRKIRWKEEKMLELQKLDPAFYVKIGILLKKLNEKAAKEEESYIVLSQIRKIRIAAIDILRTRLHKILNIVSSNPHISRDIMEKLTLEERVLYVQLCDFIEKWQDNIISIIEEGDIIG